VNNKINKLSRSDIESYIKSKLPHIPNNQIKLSIDLLIDQIIEAVAMDEKVEIRGFGTFSKKYIKPRKFINPKTKKVSYLGETETIHFKPSKKLTKIL
jgi:integration host factor subunit beta|tara:strand:- start:294 stop:587 length:294 start_codon:yes stop_codon:yes gene_type:complete